MFRKADRDRIIPALDRIEREVAKTISSQWAVTFVKEIERLEERLTYKIESATGKLQSIEQGQNVLKADLDGLRDGAHLATQAQSDSYSRFQQAFAALEHRLAVIERKLDGQVDWPAVTQFLARNEFSAVANEVLPNGHAKSARKTR